MGGLYFTKIWIWSSLSMVRSSSFPPEYRSRPIFFPQRCNIQAAKVVERFSNTNETYHSQNSLGLNHVPLVSEATLRYVCCKPRSRIELWRPCPVLSCPVLSGGDLLLRGGLLFCFIFHCLRNIFPSFSSCVYGASWEPLSEPRIQTPRYMHIT